MATPNIEELMKSKTVSLNYVDHAGVLQAILLTFLQKELQPQAERIKVIERESEMRRIALHDVMLESDQLRAQLADAELHTRQVERGLDKATAQLAAIRAQEPVLVVEKEPDYWSGGHFQAGSKPHIKPTKVWCLPIGTQLFTRPMPAQGVTELVDALEDAVKLNSFREFNDHIPAMRTALSKYKGAK